MIEGDNQQRKRSQLAWAFYDWANSAFAVVVISVFFPLLFKKYWGASLESTVSTFWLGATNAAGSMLVLLLAPLLGAMTDRSGRRKEFLLVMALVGIVATGSLALIGGDAWQQAALLYLLALAGFMGANVFYDALLLNVCGPSGQERDRVSALGFALGYLGGGLLFALCVLMVRQPQWFHIADATSAIKISFVLVAFWWALFSLPILVYVTESREPQPGFAVLVVAAAARVLQTLRELRELRQVVIFLGAYWLYIDGVGTVIRMALDYGLSLGFDQGNLIVALLITQFVGFPATFLYGRATRYIGVRSGILFGLAIYIGVTIWGSLMQTVAEFYALAVIVGLAQGGVQALSRSLYARLIPKDQASELFGFYNMVGKSAAILGPFLMGWLALATGSHRMAILSILVLFIGGFLMLLWVKPPDD